MKQIVFALSNINAAIGSALVNVGISPCFENLRCVETWSIMESEPQYSRMAVSTIAHESAVSCSTTSSSSTHRNTRIDFGLNEIILGNIQTNSALCVDNVHPVLALAQNAQYVNANNTIQADSFIVTPTRLVIEAPGRTWVEDPERRVICNPPTQLTYTSAISNSGFWVIRAAVSFDQENPRMDGDEHFNYTVTSSFRLDTTSRITTIPLEDFQTLIDRIRQMSGLVFTETQDGRSRLVNCQDNLHLLPTVSFTTYVGDSSPVVRLVVYPEDYMTRDCILTLQPANPTQQRVIGENVLRHFTIHFDQSRRAIGFCDPL